MTGRRCAHSDDHGSMSFLLLVTMLGLMFSALLVPMIVTSSRTTTFDRTRVQALDAAQAGIDVALGAIRGGVTSGVGDSAKLPCGPGSGSVATSSVAAYTVAVEYFTDDPRAEPYPSGKAMKCVAGYGTFDPTTGITTPRFARVTSVGSVRVPMNGSSDSRTLTSVYTFRTSNVSLPGGLLQVSSSGAAWCLDATSATPLTDTVVDLRPCSPASPAAPQQVFAYRTDLTLQLISSITAANPNGLCLTPASLPAASGDQVKLAQCGTLGTPATYTQQWSYTESGQYRAAQSDSVSTGNLPNLCLNATGPDTRQRVVVGGCGTGWLPSAAVGGGAAALPQWVNYSEFGRCLDVTALNPDTNFLIDYPCKQNPNPGAKSWNQAFTAPSLAGVVSATGQIYTTPGQRYCLTSPGVIGGYVTVRTCVTGNALQIWTVNGGGAPLSYAAKYTVVNGSLCLGLGSPDPSLNAYSTIVVKSCTGAADQKWNAVSSVLSSPLGNTYEK